jgi:hypothetical protein
MRDHFHNKEFEKVKDIYLLLDVVVRARLRFFDRLIERLFKLLTHETQFKYLSSSDKVDIL